MIVNLWLEYAKRKSGLILGKWWLKWIVRVRATKCPELFILTCSLYIKMLTFYISTGGAGSILLIRRNSLLLRETMSRNKHNTRLVSAGQPRRGRLRAVGRGRSEARGAGCLCASLGSPLTESARRRACEVKAAAPAGCAAGGEWVRCAALSIGPPECLKMYLECTGVVWCLTQIVYFI